MGQLHRIVAGIGLSVLTALPVAAQSQAETLADIRQQLSVLYVEVQRLNRELSTTGGVAGGAGTSGSALQRIDAMEAQLQSLTAHTEELEFRITSVVRDGTNRIGDLEFRLCELEPNCDIGSLGETPTLGGVDTTVNVPVPPATGGDTVQLAVGEQSDFDAAKSALDQDRFAEAAQQFATFAQTYPGSPLTGEAHYYRGVALGQSGDTANAARAYLESFSGSPQGSVAPQALFELGMALNDLGQSHEACVTLGEVGTRFPASSVALDANAALQSIGCN